MGLHPSYSLLLFIITSSCSAADEVFTSAPPEATIQVNVIFPKSDKLLAREYAVHLDVSKGFFRGGKCAGTIVGDAAILTSAHCISPGDKVAVNGVPVEMGVVIDDTNDHIIFNTTNMTFDSFATFGDPVEEGGRIKYWGSPAKFTMLYREGYKAGTYDTHHTVYDVNGYRGDSGAGIFNQSNELIGVISYLSHVDSFGMMASFPFNFTAEQLDSVGVQKAPQLMAGPDVEVVLDYGDGHGPVSNRAKPPTEAVQE